MMPPRVADTPRRGASPPGTPPCVPCGLRSPDTSTAFPPARPPYRPTLPAPPECRPPPPHPQRLHAPETAARCASAPRRLSWPCSYSVLPGIYPGGSRDRRVFPALSRKVRRMRVPIAEHDSATRAYLYDRNTAAIPRQQKGSLL